MIGLFFCLFFIPLYKFNVMKYTEETIKPIFEAILEGVRKGDAVRKVLTLPDMPSTKTFYKWLENEERGKQYARACEYRADAIFEEILNICDDKTEDYISTKSGAVGNNAAVQRARLQVDTRKWIVSKLNPKKYSDKIQNEVSGDMAINWIETKTNDINK